MQRCDKIALREGEGISHFPYWCLMTIWKTDLNGKCSIGSQNSPNSTRTKTSVFHNFVTWVSLDLLKQHWPQMLKTTEKYELTNVSPDKTSSSEIRLCPSRKSSYRSFICFRTYGHEEGSKMWANCKYTVITQLLIDECSLYQIWLNNCCACNKNVCYFKISGRSHWTIIISVCKGRIFEDYTMKVSRILTPDITTTQPLLLMFLPYAIHSTWCSVSVFAQF